MPVSPTCGRSSPGRRGFASAWRRSKACAKRPPGRLNPMVSPAAARSWPPRADPPGRGRPPAWSSVLEGAPLPAGHPFVGLDASPPQTLPSAPERGAVVPIGHPPGQLRRFWVVVMEAGGGVREVEGAQALLVGVHHGALSDPLGTGRGVYCAGTSYSDVSGWTSKCLPSPSFGALGFRASAAVGWNRPKGLSNRPHTLERRRPRG